MTQPPPTDPSNPFRPPTPDQGQPLGTQPQYGSPPQQEQPQHGQPQHGQPQYGQPRYGQPQHGQPFGGQTQPPYGASPYGGLPYGASPYPPQRESGVNGLAIASFVLGLIGIGVVLAIPFGFVALSQIRKRGQRGKGFAAAGLVLSVLWIVGVGAAVYAVVNAQADRDSSGEIVKAGYVSIDDLRVGDCLKEFDEDDFAVLVQVEPCAEPHVGQVFAVFDLPRTDYPNQDAIAVDAEQGCRERGTAVAPTALDDPSLSFSYYAPSVDTSSVGDRFVVCIAASDTPQPGSILD